MCQPNAWSGRVDDDHQSSYYSLRSVLIKDTFETSVEGFPRAYEQVARSSVDSWMARTKCLFLTTREDTKISIFALAATGNNTTSVRSETGMSFDTASLGLRSMTKKRLMDAQSVVSASLLMVTTHACAHRTTRSLCNRGKAAF